jgi:non-homologous end joining protein Ku
MSARDRLAEVIYQAAFDRHVLIDRTDCAALAATARAFIGDEIHWEADIRARRCRDDGQPDGTEVHMLRIAESIARGDTK